MSGYKSDISRLDSPWRREALPPAQVLERLGLNPEDDLADIGCGIGYFALPARAMLAEGRMLYAVDPSRKMLEELERRVAEQGIPGIQSIQSQPYRIPLADACVDFILLANVLHEIQEKKRFLQELRRLLRSGGRVGLVEWVPGEMEMGPPAAERLPGPEADLLFAQAEFRLLETMEFGDKFYGKVYGA